MLSVADDQVISLEGLAQTECYAKVQQALQNQARFVEFSKGNFRGIKMIDVVLPLSAVFTECDFTGALMAIKESYHARFNHCSFDEAIFFNGEWRNPDFASCSLNKTVIVQNDLEWTSNFNFRDCDTSQIITTLRWQNCSDFVMLNRRG
jgi:uncharacterized protein YjbI with pentapeptide repeats